MDFSQAILVNLTTDKPESIRQGMDDLEVESLAMKLHNRFFWPEKLVIKIPFMTFFTMDVIHQPCQRICLLDYNINQEKNNSLFLAATSEPVFLPNLMVI